MYGRDDFRLEQLEKEELWRVLGHDYAMHGMPLPDDSHSAMREGFKACLSQHGRSPRTTDPHVRKWLTIRANALRRERKVASNISPEALKIIDTPMCPVTLTALTKATLEDSDWSVDRLNNDLAYSLGNIAILSTRANKAKGTKSLNQVRELGQRANSSEGLEPKEWRRLEALMYGPCQVSHRDPYLVRQVAPLHRWVIRETQQEWQDLFVQIATRVDRQQCDEYFADMSAAKIRTAARRLLNTVQKRLPKLPVAYDIWFDHDVFDLLRRFLATIVAHGGDPRMMLRGLYPAYDIDGPLKEGLGINTKGRLFEIPTDKRDKDRYFAMRRAR